MSDDVNYKDLMIAKALTKEELDQEAVWAEQFEHWWDAEGQYHRAGGTDYAKTFAWWAWLNREKSQQVKFDEMRKKIEDQIDILKAASKSHAYNYREQNIMLSQADDLEKILRGKHD